MSRFCNSFGRYVRGPCERPDERGKAATIGCYQPAYAEAKVAQAQHGRRKRRYAM